MKLVLFACAVLAVAGCANSRHLSKRATDFNKAIERNTNTVTLMNAVRSSERLPMFYSRLGSMTYSGSVSPSASATVNLASTASGNPLALAIGGEDGGNSNFDALVGEDFYRAILASIDAQTVKFYRDQGWPDDLLFQLMVERIEFQGASINKRLSDFSTVDFLSEEGKKSLWTEALPEHDPEELAVIDNDPLKPKQYLLFRAVVKTIANPKRYRIRLQVDQSAPQSECGPSGKGPFAPGFDKTICKGLNGFRRAFELSNAADVDVGFAGDAAADFIVQNGVVFRKVGPDAQCVVFLDRRASKSVDRKAILNELNLSADAPTCDFAARVESALELISSTALRSILQRADLDREQDETLEDSRQRVAKFLSDGFFIGETGVAESAKNNRLNVVLRSPNSMLYYLGELLRAQNMKASEFIRACGRYTITSWTENETEQQGDFVFGANYPCVSLNDLKAQWRQPDLNEGQRDRALFYLERLQAKRRLRNRGYFAFKFGGHEYWISEHPAVRGRTMQAVTLINELFFQKQEASDPPAVTFLNGQAF